MSYVYRNRNTGDVVEYDQASARLDRLDNWDRISEPAPEPADPPTPVRPAQSATKDVWIGWAIACGATRDEAAKLTKDELISGYADRSPGDGHGQDDDDQ